MIQKRYQHYTKDGIVWTDWFDTAKNDSELNVLKKEDKYQLKNKLLNEFRIIEEG